MEPLPSGLRPAPEPPFPRPSLSEVLSSRVGVGGVAAILFAVALAHRLVLAVWTKTISTDGAYYLWMAEACAEGRLEDALSQFRGIHPLYPLLTALLGAPAGNLEASAYVISIASGALSVVPLYVLVRLWWNDRIAFWTGILYALHPYLSLEGSEVMTTSLFLALFLTSVALLALALRSRDLTLYPIAGGTAGLCILTRPEGILLLPVFGATVALSLLRLLRPAQPGRASGVQVLRLCGGAAMFALTVIVILSPYLLWIHGRTGKWSFTARPAAGKLVQTLGEEAPELPSRLESPSAPASPPPSQTLFDVGRRFSATLYVVLIPFLLLGLAFTGRAGGRWRVLTAPALLAFLTAAPALVLYGVTGGSYTISHRYFLTGAVFLLPWSAAGLLVAADAATTWGDRLPFLRGRLAGGSLLMLLALAALPAKSLGPRRADEAPFVEAGGWIRSQRTEGTRTALVAREKLAYYAGVLPVSIPTSSRESDAKEYVAHLHALGRTAGASRLLLDERSLRKMPAELTAALEAGGFRIERRFPASEGQDGRVNAVWVYRLP